MKKVFLFFPVQVRDLSPFKCGVKWLTWAYKSDSGTYYTESSHRIFEAQSRVTEYIRTIKTPLQLKATVYQVPLYSASTFNIISWKTIVSNDKYTGVKRHYLTVAFSCNGNSFKFKKQVPCSAVTKSLECGALAIAGCRKHEFRLWLLNNLTKKTYGWQRAD